ncbi:MAG: rRNA small subunit methyltransferase 1, partial [Methanomicrobia archaeon]|nr:rRNA small subunit methyltransferase 1 [Methanomicrobia archaeon]
MKTRRLTYKDGHHPLYIVATPIGNLKEMTPRALEILNMVDFVAREDTRHSGLLLSHFSIKKPLIACHEHNEAEASEKIIALITSGKTVAYMSDAGYPGISDPGERLIAKAIDQDIDVSVISGSNAMLLALIGSGLPTEHFYFHGFLP